MATLTSNLSRVVRAVSGLSRALSPRRVIPGGRRLGDEFADTVAESVRRRTADGQNDPNGRPLARLNFRYKRRKISQGYDGRILVRTGEMLDPRQLRGRITVTADRLIMAAGLDAETQKKVDWAHRGFKTRPKRPFYELGRAGKQALDPVCREATASACVEARKI